MNKYWKGIIIILLSSYLFLQVLDIRGLTPQTWAYTAPPQGSYEENGYDPVFASQVVAKGDSDSNLPVVLRVPRTGFLLLLVFSFVAGLLSFTSPCTLPILPAYFAYTFQSDRRRILLMTFAFFLGLALVFSLMGATATFLGSFIRSHYSLFLTGGGAFITLMGIISLSGKGFSGFYFKSRPSASFFGSFVFGSTFAIGWASCIGPILAGLFILASTQEGALSGSILLFIYALGLSLPLVMLSTFFHRLNSEGLFWSIIRGKGWDVTVSGRTLHLHTNNLIAGALLIILGILMMTGYLTYINRVVPVELQVWFAGIEEWILGIAK